MESTVNEFGFDHSKDTVKAFKGVNAYLIQDGKFYTNSEYDNILKQWVPSPQPINEEDILGKQAEPLVSEISKIVKSLQGFIEPLKGVEEELRKGREGLRTSFNREHGLLSQAKKRIRELEEEMSKNG